MVRFLSALALAAPVLAVLWFAPSVGFLLLILLFTFRAGWEYQLLAAGCGWRGRTWDGALDSMVFALGIWAGGILPVAVLVLVFLRLMARALREASYREGIAGAGVSLLGVVWIGGAGGFIALVHTVAGGREALLFFLLVVWSNDVAAMYVGRTWGRRKLAPGLSPAKTIEGAVGGLAAGVVVGAVAGGLSLVSQLPAIAAPVVALVLGGLAQLGDLCESLLKRAAGEKDSADLIPGHGGLLDRIDGLLLAAPPFYYFLVWLGPR